MGKAINAPYIDKSSAGVGEYTWNPGLGKYIRTNKDKRETIKKLNDKHDMDIVEMGNDDHDKGLAPKLKEY